MKRNVLIGVILVGMVIWVFIQSLEKDESVTDSNVNHFSSKENNVEIEAEENEIVGIKRGNIAPDFQLETLEGETVTLSDFRGEKIMVNFWASWCPPCRAEMPDMQKVYEKYDATILAINLTSTETSEKDVKSFVDEFGLTFPILLDRNIEVADIYGIQPVPTSFFIDRQGRIANIVIGPMNEDRLVQMFHEME